MTKFEGRTPGESRFPDLYGLAIDKENGLVYGANYTDHVVQVWSLYR